MGYLVFQKIETEVSGRQETWPVLPGTARLPSFPPASPGELTPGAPYAHCARQEAGGVSGAGPDPSNTSGLTDCCPGAVRQPRHHTESGGQEAGQEGEAGKRGSSSLGSSIPPPGLHSSALQLLATTVITSAPPPRDKPVAQGFIGHLKLRPLHQ